jgi:hypothetical protein
MVIAASSSITVADAAFDAAEPGDLSGVSAAAETRIVHRRPGARSHAEGICRPRLRTDARSQAGSPARGVSSGYRFAPVSGLKQTSRFERIAALRPEQHCIRDVSVDRLGAMSPCGH